MPECAGMSLETQASVRRMKTFNLNSDEWDATRDREGWRCSGTLVGERIGGELLGATMSQIEPGSRLWPYHTHYLNEEWVIVLRGEPTLRTPEGEHVLEEGDIVCFPRGKIGAHQISNRTDSPVRVLMLSSMIRGEIIEYLSTPARFSQRTSTTKTSCSRGLDPYAVDVLGRRGLGRRDALVYRRAEPLSRVTSFECPSVRECLLTCLDAAVGQRKRVSPDAARHDTQAPVTPSCASRSGSCPWGADR